tara:strand:- start:658 stop:1290 length:633 start_codon:yes stop_codon:yes gene_type:complete
MDIKIPIVKSPKIKVVEVPFYKTTPVLTGRIPGCNPTHRDIDVHKNPGLLLDKNGVSISCADGEIPSFKPMSFNGSSLQIVEQVPKDEEEKPVTNKPVIPKGLDQDEEVEPEIKPCPDPNSPLRVGGFANQDRLEKVVAFERLANGECRAIWEDVPFINTYFPSPPVAISTAGIACIAATAPLLLNVIKPAVKNLIKKLTGKKKSNDGEA